MSFEVNEQVKRDLNDIHNWDAAETNETETVTRDVERATNQSVCRTNKNHNPMAYIFPILFVILMMNGVGFGGFWMFFVFFAFFPGMFNGGCASNSQRSKNMS